MAYTKGLSAKDVDCDAYGRPASSPCAGISGYHQVRINAAAKRTRELNQAAKAGAKKGTS